MGVRAKFVVNTITKSMGTSYVNGKPETGEVYSIRMYPVTGVGSPEDHSFWAATPSGTIELNTLNPAAVDQFAAVLGKSVYVDFTSAEE